MALVLCGMFARSDMGLELPTREQICWAFMESTAEAVAEAWLERLSGLTLGEAREIWPGVLGLYERA